MGIDLPVKQFQAGSRSDAVAIEDVHIAFSRCVQLHSIHTIKHTRL